MGLDIKFSELAAYENDAVYSRDFVMQQLCTDTRIMQQGDTYLAIKGERFDGHDFIDTALSSGASSLVVSRNVNADVPSIRVSDTVVALGNVAKIYRRKLSSKVVGITGSNGKTTVKGMVESICSRHGRVTATVANNNNMIGVPQTMLAASQQDDVVIVEMGTSESGEIAYLSNIVEPDVSIITNISESHLSGIGSKEDVFAEKSSIIQATRNGGTVVINEDDPFSDKVRQMVTVDSVLGYGFSAEADISGEYRNTSGGVKVFARSPLGQFEYEMSVSGKHNVANSFAAIAICCAVGVDVDSMVAGLKGYSGAKGRLQAVQLKRGISLIDDTYNANPASSIAALDVLSECDGRKIFVFAGMAELGGQEAVLHELVGRKATESGIDALFALGEVTEPAVNIFKGEKFRFNSIDELVVNLLDFLKSGDVILVKGSRRYQMDLVSKRLQRELG